MSKIIGISMCFCLLLVSSTRADVASNEAFCANVLAEACDSLLLQLSLPIDGPLFLLPVNGYHGDLFYDRLADQLHEQGVALYLSDSASGRAPSLQTSLDRFELAYRGVNSGLISRGRVERSCIVSATARLLAEDGRLLRAATLSALKRVETLDYDAAKLARSGSGFYAPEMPPSVFQRVVEPALILSITGALVYLFFASH